METNYFFSSLINSPTFSTPLPILFHSFTRFDRSFLLNYLVLLNPFLSSNRLKLNPLVNSITSLKSEFTYSLLRLELTRPLHSLICYIIFYFSYEAEN